MFSPATIAFAVVAIVFALGGFISNGFITAVILREWTKSRSLASNEQLLLSLAVSNFWATALLIPFYINATFRDDSISNLFLLPGLYLLATFVIMSRFWFTAWLCFFYCIKIVNSTHSLFLWCKLRILWLIPRFLAGSLFCSFLFSAFALQFTSRQIQSNIAVNVTNTTEVKTSKHTLNTFEAFFLAVGSGCPFLVVLLCSILVVASLCRHVCRITGKDIHGRSLQTEVHIKAAWTVLSLLLLYISYYAAHTLSIIVTLGKDEGILAAMVRIVYPSAQASILLLVNPKLKQAATQVLQRVKV
ncbi:taste receptor type 2 member 8-like [Anolis sagrei]|uniref:taste receptor type 2 member 8-like n=1 Tax=Anolis sagrei TaxID=38937 RepID=UPI00295B1381|nr:taste receptor type 2 member 8-like [Anolis sagrei ordinatus]